MGTMVAVAGPHTGTVQSSRLYTPPDESARGGLRGVIEMPAGDQVRDVFAVPRGDPSRVYRAAVDAEKRAFVLRGLPVGHYDLVVIGSAAFYEGLELTRSPSTLASRDVQAIASNLMASVPFFDTKCVHRCEGQAGAGGQARCVLQELRTRPVTLQDASVRSDLQIRSLKLAWVEEVGGGRWQLVQTREILRQEVGPGDTRGVLPHRFAPQLGGFRVTDDVKDIGTARLK